MLPKSFDFTQDPSFLKISALTFPSAYNCFLLLETQVYKLLTIPSYTVRGGLKTSWRASGIIVPRSGKPIRRLARIYIFRFMSLYPRAELSSNEVEIGDSPGSIVVLLSHLQPIIMMLNRCNENVFTFSSSITIQVGAMAVLLLLLFVHMNQIRWPYYCIVRIHPLWQHFVLWLLNHIPSVNDAITDIQKLPEIFLSIFFCFSSCWKCHKELNYGCCYWYHNYVTLCILLRIIQSYSKVKTLIVELVAQSFELKTISGDLLYTIESVMVSEMLDELNLSYISIAFIQTAFRPRKVLVFTLLCSVLTRKQYKSGDFYTICCLTMVLVHSLSKLGFMFLAFLLGSFLSHCVLVHSCVRFAKVISFPCMIREMATCIFISKSTLQKYLFRHWTVIFDVNIEVSIKLEKLTLEKPFYCTTSIRHVWTYTTCLWWSLCFYQSDNDAHISALGCNAHRQDWQFGSVSTDAELWLTLHNSICIFIGFFYVFILALGFGGMWKIPLRIFHGPTF